MALMRVYQHSSFRGASGDFNQNLRYVGDFWNDEITSIKVISGTWEIFQHSNYKGRKVTLTPGEYPNIAISPGGLENDSISSVKIVED